MEGTPFQGLLNWRARIADEFPGGIGTERLMIFRSVKAGNGSPPCRMGISGQGVDGLETAPSTALQFQGYLGPGTEDV